MEADAHALYRFQMLRNAKLARSTDLRNLLNQDQLCQLFQCPAKWLAGGITPDRTPELHSYLKKELKIQEVDFEAFAQKVDVPFFTKQNDIWMADFYAQLSTQKVLWKKGSGYSPDGLLRNKPFIRIQDGSHVEPFRNDKTSAVYIMNEFRSDITSHYVKIEITKNEDALRFLRELGITDFDNVEEVITNTLEKYNNANCNILHDEHMRDIYAIEKAYAIDDEKKKQRLLQYLRITPFIRTDCITQGVQENAIYKSPNELYFKNDSLMIYFNNNSMRFVWSGYSENTCNLFEKFGVARYIRIERRQHDQRNFVHIKSFHGNHERGVDRFDPGIIIDGFSEAMKSHTLEKSIFIWDGIAIPHADCILGTVERSTRQDYTNIEKEERISEFGKLLRETPWLPDSQGNFKKPCKLKLDDLPNTFSHNENLARKLGMESDDIKKLVDLGIIKYETAELARKIELLSPEKMKQLNDFLNLEEREDLQKIDQYEMGDISRNNDVDNIAKDIIKRAIVQRKKKEPRISADSDDAVDFDEDDYTKPAIDYNKKIEQTKQRSADEIQSILQLEELSTKASECEKYSFGWFKALLELESLGSNENNAHSREISISFANVERERGTTRTLILKHPNRYIPQFMEDLADIPLELRFADQQTIKVAIEVVNVKSYTLRIKLKTGDQIDGIDLSFVVEARIRTKNPSFLIDKLKDEFNKLDFADDYNFQSNLCKNIEFIFGPPGTGKTTYLAKNVIIPMMKKTENFKILVLTLTNKAADVLTRQIIDNIDTGNSYKKWLVRFGATNDSVIEQQGIYRDKTFDIRSTKQNVTVTTIARFPYDYFLPDGGTRLHLNALNWDYIIFDEASMIPIANIIYPLYKKTPKKFIIAGDPFQIEPITAVDIWKSENIYTMVKLNSFTNPTTIPHFYDIELLTTQYRSIPEIGEIFSNFAYGGVLQHHRSCESQKSLMINDIFNVASLNIIKFPVSKYESIYRPKRLHGKSNYQVYSALFTFEFAKWLSSLIATVQENDFFKIGIIAPYRAQADLIDKLLSSITVAKNIDIQVDTIHGFLGDECDIIIAVFNPPSSSSKFASPEILLNKHSIINVSISRARDYLFIIMPNDETDNIQNLILVKEIEALCKQQSSCFERQSNDIEEIIFGSNSYLEDNSFSTSHQQVNVYGDPERRYEIRSEDSAVDVQIHSAL